MQACDYLEVAASSRAIVRTRTVGMSRLATDNSQSSRCGRGGKHAIDDVLSLGVGVGFTEADTEEQGSEHEPSQKVAEPCLDAHPAL